MTYVQNDLHMILYHMTILKLREEKAEKRMLKGNAIIIIIIIIIY